VLQEALIKCIPPALSVWFRELRPSVPFLKFAEVVGFTPEGWHLYSSRRFPPPAPCEGAEVKLSGTIQFRPAPSHGVGGLTTSANFRNRTRRAPILLSGGSHDDKLKHVGHWRTRFLELE
jgi:hypothetical protein